MTRRRCPYAEKMYTDFEKAQGVHCKPFYKEKGYILDEEGKVVKSP